jgi:hypothetical protein
MKTEPFLPCLPHLPVRLSSCWSQALTDERATSISSYLRADLPSHCKIKLAPLAVPPSPTNVQLVLPRRPATGYITRDEFRACDLHLHRIKLVSMCNILANEPNSPWHYFLNRTEIHEVICSALRNQHSMSR